MKVKELKRILDDMIKDGKEEYDVCIVDGIIYDDVKRIEISYDSETDSGMIGVLLLKGGDSRDVL